MKTRKEVEHTADRSFAIEGRNLGELFASAARAIFAVQPPKATKFARILREVRVEGTDRETLLVNWLNELLYLQERWRETFDACEVLEVSDTAIHARVSGRSGLGRSPVKAVTFHGLRIQPTGKGLQATLVLDV